MNVLKLSFCALKSSFQNFHNKKQSYVSTHEEVLGKCQANFILEKIVFP